MCSINPSTKKLVIGKNYRYQLGNIITAQNNDIMLKDIISFQKRYNAHYEIKQAYYFNYLDENMTCTHIVKVV